MYGTTFTLPFGTGACGFAATATATLPIGRLIGAGAGFAAGGGVWIDDLPLAGLVVAGLPAATTAADVNFEPFPAATGDAFVCDAAAVFLAGGASAAAVVLATGFSAGLVADLLATGLLAATFLATGWLAAAFLATGLLAAAFGMGFFGATFFVTAFLLTALPAAGFFAAAATTGFFLTGGFLTAGFLIAFFTAAFEAAGFLATGFAATGFLAAGFADFFDAVLAAFFAGFLTATSGFSLYSLVTGKRAVIPCPAVCGNHDDARGRVL